MLHIWKKACSIAHSLMIIVLMLAGTNRVAQPAQARFMEAKSKVHRVFPDPIVQPVAVKGEGALPCDNPQTTTAVNQAIADIQAQIVHVTDAARRDRLMAQMNELRGKQTPASAQPLALSDLDHLLSVDAGVSQKNPLNKPQVKAPNLVEAGGQVTGKISAGDTGLPLSNVSIYLYQGDSFGTVAYASTDANGVYTLTNVSAGSYRALYVPERQEDVHAYQYSGNVSRLSQATQIIVTNGNTTANVDAVLPVGGRITGIVTTQDTNEALSNVYVSVYELEADYLQGTVLYTSTKSLGDYRSAPMPTGKYLVLFNPDYRVSPDRFYQWSYFGDAHKRSLAALVTVTQGGTTSGVNIALKRGAIIAGQVRDQDTNVPISGAHISAFRRDDGFTEGNRGGAASEADINGVFQLTGLFTGTYIVGFETEYNAFGTYIGEYFDDTTNQNLATPLTLTTITTIGGINATLKNGGRISGRVTGADTGLGVSGVKVTAYDCRGWYSKQTTTDSGGNYTLAPLASNKYRMQFEDNSSGYISKYYLDAPDLARATAIDLVAPNVISTTNISLGRGGVINGIVTATDTGLPLSAIQVIAYGYNADTGNYYNKSAVTNSAGIYTLSGLPIARYSLYFQPSSYRYYDSNSSARFYADISTYDRVSITGTETVPNINQALSRAGVVIGRITSADIGQGVSAQIRAVNLGNYNSGYNFSDASGYYTFTNLAAGNYSLEFSSYNTDYTDEYYDNKPTAQQANPISVSAGMTVTNINATLEKGARLSGRVTDGSGQPLNSIVSIYDTKDQYVVGASIDANGYYTSYFGLPSGDYKVKFELSSFADSSNICDTSTTLLSKPQSSAGTGFARQFYNNKPSFQSADVVSVRSTSAVSGINASLSTTSYQITGRVLSGTVPYPNISVYAAGGIYATTDTGGYYTFTNMMTGTQTFGPNFLSGVIITPTQRTVLVTSDVTGQDFVVGISTPPKKMVYLPTVVR